MTRAIAGRIGLRPLSALLVAAFLSSPALAASELFPYRMPWDDNSANFTNLAVWNHKPAGKFGFVQVKDGHLHAGSERLRLLGVNIVFGSTAPAHEEADKIAARLARFGINIVRFHHLDSLPVPDGLLQRDRRTLDPDFLERLDYFIAALKREGIYSDLNLHVGRKYPGFADWGESTPKYWKGVDNFFPPMVALQKDYARDLLLHRNPYTGNRYVEEPAVALIEINNENGLLREWRNGSLDEMTEPYRGELTRQWHAWLKARYADTAAVFRAWGGREEALGIEMFSPRINAKSGEAGWSLQTVGEARAELASDTDGAAMLRLIQPGRENWHTQLHQNGLAFEPDRPYTLTFRMRADRPMKFSAQAMQAHAPWQILWQQEIAVDTEWCDYRLSFAPSTGESKARLTLGHLGNQQGALWLQNASLRPGGTVGLLHDERLENDSIPIVARNALQSRTPAGQRDWIAFLWDTENAYWQGMQRFLKEELHARPLIVGTQVSYSPAMLQAGLDVVDAHAYWQHPVFPGKPWDPENWRIANSPMAGAADGGTLADLALRRVPGKPFIVTEYNHSAPSHYQGEALPLAGAYAALQDWDGLFLYSYGAHRKLWDPGFINNYFDSHANPVKMTSLIATAALLRRADVSAAPAGSGPQPSRTAWVEALRASWRMPGADALNGTPRSEALIRSVSIASPAAQATPLPWRSVTNELEWGMNDGRTVVIDTPRNKGLVGAKTRQPFDASGVSLALVDARNDWGVVIATLLEGDRFTGPGRILVSTLGQVENTGQQWTDNRQTSLGRHWGEAPTLVEGIAARIRLPVPVARVSAWALDERGERRQAIPVTGGDVAELLTGPQYRTLWYELEVR